MDVKFCKRCDKTKSIDCFSKSKNRPDGRNFYCKECCHNAFMARYSRDSENILQRNRERDKLNPEKSKRYRKKWNDNNRDKIRESSKKWQKERRRIVKQGISNEQYENLFNSQDRRCAICGYLDEGDPNKWALDHDYSCCTERNYSCKKCIRGILCKTCNSGLGYFKDNAEILKKAVAYLEEAKRPFSEEEQYG